MAPVWLTRGRAAAKAALGTLVTLYIVGTVHFVDHACDSVEQLLPREVIGQELALSHLTDHLCQHIAQKKPHKPLVISVHGPPGVGKTYTHLWLARALYNKQPGAELDCPGIHCRGYKVIYGMDYLSGQVEARLDVVRAEVVSHLSTAPDALLVVEEYDKLDCEARGLWRQLLQHPERANITSHRAVILLESNLGMTELEELITRLGDRSKVTMQEAEQLLKDVVFDEWRKSDCEGYADTLKLMGLIDVFLPYLPLGRSHMPQLVELALNQRAARLRGQAIRLQWEQGVVDLVASKVVFEGEYPLDGAKVVETAMTRSVGRVLRQAQAQPGCKARHGCTIRLALQGQDGLKALVANNTTGGTPTPTPPSQQQQQKQKRTVPPLLQQHPKQQQQQQGHGSSHTDEL